MSSVPAWLSAFLSLRRLSMVLVWLSAYVGCDRMVRLRSGMSSSELLGPPGYRAIRGITPVKFPLLQTTISEVSCTVPSVGSFFIHFDRGITTPSWHEECLLPWGRTPASNNRTSRAADASTLLAKLTNTDSECLHTYSLVVCKFTACVPYVFTTRRERLYTCV